MAAERVREFLDERGVDFKTHTHEEAVTAQQVAAVEHESGWHIAKPVLLMADGELVMAVLCAPQLVDLARATEVLGADDVRLASEPEFVDRFPDCAPGAEPIFGDLYDVPTLVDERVLEEQRVQFAAGSHTETLDIATDDYVRLTEPRTVNVGVLAD